MGNQHSAKPLKLDGKAKLAADRFDEDEVHVLYKTWYDMAERHQGKGMDKDTFLQYFPLNGLLGERLFFQFDQKKNGLIDFEEFIIGLSIVCRGSSDEKVHFVFDMYDVSKDKTVSIDDLATLLNQIPIEKLTHTEEYYRQVESGAENPGSDTSTFGHVDTYTNHDVAERAFKECALNNEGTVFR